MEKIGNLQKTRGFLSHSKQEVLKILPLQKKEILKIEKIRNFLPHSKQEVLKMEKKGDLKFIVEKIILILLFVGLAYAVYKALEVLTGI